MEKGEKDYLSFVYVGVLEERKGSLPGALGK